MTDPETGCTDAEIEAANLQQLWEEEKAAMAWWDWQDQLAEMRKDLDE
jgi:hypothetical protein